MHNMNLSPLISEEEIQKKVHNMGQTLTAKYKSQQIVAICVLKGSFMFYSDLIRAIDTDVICEYMAVSSYGNSSQSSGEVKINLDLTGTIRDRHVLLIEDIVDTGLTLNFLKNHLAMRGPRSVATAALLLKPGALKVDCAVDHVGFEISNDFVVGYGLDYQGYFRNLPYIAQVQSLS